MLPQTSPSLQPLVNKLSLWTDLDEADRQALLELPHRIKAVPRHSYLVREGEAATHTSLVLSGFAIRQKVVGGGARQIMSVHMRGDMVDLQNAMVPLADHNVQMLTDGEIALLPREAVRQIAFERPRIGMAMWIDTLVDGSIFREWIANVGRRDAHARIAHLLCELSLRLEVAGLGKATDYDLPMTQEQIADCVGLTPVHVNRTLKTLESQGLIERKSSRAVTIDNWNKPAQAADFDDTYLHLRRTEAEFGQGPLAT